MDNKQRKEFWDVLCSLDGNDIQNDKKLLMDKIVYPRYLFRYRDVSFSSLDSLRTNHLYFSSANYYDDPFDTFLHIDIEKIRTEFETNFASEEDICRLSNAFTSILDNSNIQPPAEFVSLVSNPQKLKQLHQNGLTNAFLSHALNLRNEIRKDTWSICFSENGLNETLWLKYANQYKGFVLMYDLNNTENFRCGKMDKCKNCGIFNYGTPLFPMYYSDEPYDATNFAKYIMGQIVATQMNIQIPQFVFNEFGKMTWERERTTLIKKKCHQYDEEWRMITNCQMRPPIMMEWIPYGIILGLRMSQSEENLVISLARQAGIKNIYKSIIDKNNKLDAYLISEGHT